MAKDDKIAVILNGSPRVVNGNTIEVINWTRDALRDNKWQADLYSLYNMEFRGCLHCDKCKPILDKPGCVLQDDLTQILNRVHQAELIVLASPVYCWSVSGCLSTALDRFYSMFKTDRSLLRNKKFVGLFTSGGDVFSGMEMCVEMARKLVAFAQGHYVGTIFAASCQEPAEVKQRIDLKNQISDFIKTI